MLTFAPECDTVHAPMTDVIEHSRCFFVDDTRSIKPGWSVRQ